MNIDDVTFGSDGLVVAVVQQHDTRDVLMVAYMNAEAVRRTIDEGRVTFWSRSRNELWRKGDTSGNSQRLVAITADCDGDALLVSVDQTGPACHTGSTSCFEGSRELQTGPRHAPNSMLQWRRDQWSPS